MIYTERCASYFGEECEDPYCPACKCIDPPALLPEDEQMNYGAKIRDAVRSFKTLFSIPDPDERKDAALACMEWIEETLYEDCRQAYRDFHEEIMIVSLIAYWGIEKKKDDRLDPMIKEWDFDKKWDEVYQRSCDMECMYFPDLHYWLGAFKEYIDAVSEFCTPSLPYEYYKTLSSIGQLIELSADHQNDCADEELQRQYDEETMQDKYYELVC